MNPTIIPNTFQHPNFYIDVLDEYLTPEESKVLTHAIREILGWRDSLQTRQKHIARDIFLNGRTVNGKKVYGGVNLCKEAIERALDALHLFRILVKSGSPRDPRGQLYELTEDVSQIDIEGLQARKYGKKTANKTRLHKSSSNKNHARLSDRPVNNSPMAQASNSPMAQASSSPIVQASNSPMAQASSSPVRQAERNPEGETQKEKPRERAEAAKSQASTGSRDPLSLLSSSPIGDIFCDVFGKEKAQLLNKTQIKMLLSIEGETALSYARKAMEDLEGRGVKDVWKKISLIKTRMEELVNLDIAPKKSEMMSAPAAAKCGLGGVPNPPAYTFKAKQRRANLDYLESLISSKMADVVDVQPLAAIAGA